jgi:hypothetical protein
VYLGRKRGTTGPRTAASSTSLKQSSVLAAKRLRPHRKAGPAPGRKQPAHRSEQRPVGGRVARPLPSAAEDRRLMAQHHDLKLPLSAATGEQAETQHRTRYSKDTSTTRSLNRLDRDHQHRPPGRIEFLYPTPFAVVGGTGAFSNLHGHGDFCVFPVGEGFSETFTGTFTLGG